MLAHVHTFNLETGSHKPVTAARRYIAEQALVPPALLNVRRNEHTTDRFFWGEKGLFSAQYAEENHFLFPSLRAIVDTVKDRGPGGHILTGPVFVTGAEPGDALEVKVLSIDLPIAYGYNGCSGFIRENCAAGRGPTLPASLRRPLHAVLV